MTELKLNFAYIPTFDQLFTVYFTLKVNISVVPEFVIVLFQIAAISNML